MVQKDSKIKKETIEIELVWGPMDGVVIKMQAPYESVIFLKSPFRDDVRYVYEFDNDEGNNQFPLIYRFKQYLRV